MKNKFFEYYPLKEEQFDQLWKEALFVFDTNVLLNLYRYTLETSNELIRIFKELGDRLWLPYQVAKEYQVRRLEVILREENKFENIIAILDKNFDNIKTELTPLSRHPLINTKLIIEAVEKCINKIKKDLSSKKENEYPNWFAKDEIRDKISELFNNKIGEKFSDDEIEKIKEEGNFRFKNKIPPGYTDFKKDNLEKDNSLINDENNSFGDLIIWYEIIKKAKEEKKPIILIQDERKEDWWWIISGKIIGARHELIREIKDKAGTMFYMYDTDRFIKYAQDYLKSQVNSKVSKELKDFKEESLKEFDWRAALASIGKAVASFQNLKLNLDNYEIPKFNLPNLDNYEIPKFNEQLSEIIRNFDVSIYSLDKLKQDLLNKFNYISNIDIKFDETSNTINCTFTLSSIPEKIYTILKAVYAQIPLNNRNLILIAKDSKFNTVGYLKFIDGIMNIQ
jgi:sugar-specific transcriptional regulator TrmB